MALIFHQSSSITFGTEDLPLPVIGIVDGTRAQNLSLAPGMHGRLLTFMLGEWVEGWYAPFITTPEVPEFSVEASDMHGLPSNRAGKAGWHLTLDDNLNTWDLVPPVTPDEPEYITWAGLVSRAVGKTLMQDQLFIITDQSDRLVKIAYISTPGKMAFEEVMTDYGQLSHSKIE